MGDTTQSIYTWLASQGTEGALVLAEIERLRGVVTDAYPIVLVYAERFARDYERQDTVMHYGSSVQVEHGRMLNAMRTALAAGKGGG